jgi:hypothetical protein
MIYRMFKQYTTACSMHTVTSLCKHGSLNVCFSNCSPFEERDAVRVQESFPSYEVHSTTPSPPTVKHNSMAAYHNYASVAAELSYDPQYQLTKTHWIYFLYGRPTLIKEQCRIQQFTMQRNQNTASVTHVDS